ncbi:MAG: sporulation initiation factor Spo0A C-terminal domain-containing protein [Massiliimalia sp.]
MSHQLTILIGDETLWFGKYCARELSHEGYHVVTVKNDGLVIFDEIKNHRPDLVIMEYHTPNMNAAAVMNQAKLFLGFYGKYIIVSASDSWEIRQRVSAVQGAKCLIKPFDMGYLISVVKEMLSDTCEKKVMGSYSYSAEAMTAELLDLLRFPVKLKGYQYIMDAVIWGVEDLSQLESITKVLYPRLAEKHHTTAACVERAIRKAISAAWETGNREEMESVFGKLDRHPSNLQFLRGLALNIRRRMNGFRAL